MPKTVSLFVIFFVSAVLHEYLIMFAVFKPTYWAFLGMFANGFIIIMEEPFLKKTGMINSRLGNCMFWINFCIIGQPLIIVFYTLEINMMIHAQTP